jgi:hypothetical protein
VTTLGRTLARAGGAGGRALETALGVSKRPSVRWYTVVPGVCCDY